MLLQIVILGLSVKTDIPVSLLTPFSIPLLQYWTKVLSQPLHTRIKAYPYFHTENTEIVNCLEAELDVLV